MILHDDANVYAVAKIENNTIWTYGCGRFCFWIDVFEGPGIILNDNRAIQVDTNCFPLTIDESLGMEIKLIEKEDI